jgi:hypothetical protein
MTLAPMPRAVRNNNPGNLRHSKDAWAGLADVQSDPDFCVFQNAVWGFRALAITLHSKFARGLNTVQQILAEYAPPPDNDTDAYVGAVCDGMGVGPDLLLDLVKNAGQLRSFCRAIAVHEAGGWFFDPQDLDRAIDLVCNPLAARV